MPRQSVIGVAEISKVGVFVGAEVAVAVGREICVCVEATIGTSVGNLVGGRVGAGGWVVAATMLEQAIFNETRNIETTLKLIALIL